ncbi:MAG TPA: DUF998 domain-containing protein [Rhodoglobus sp.]|nr:DUF998 domain-containing protein [Rhodoglobus sp.]
MPPIRVAELLAAVAGSLSVVTALAIIWGARLTIPRDLYVSELGAQGMPTAEWFRVALLLIVAGGSLVAWAGRGIRSRVRVLDAWTPSVSLWVGSALFLFASQVTCTPGCPVPYGPDFVWQDFWHTTAAVLAFAAACWAMLQSAFARGHRVLAVISAASGISVAVIAGAGGLMSVFRWQAEFGSRLEFVATTMAIGWLVLLGATIVGRILKPVEQVTAVAA